MSQTINAELEYQTKIAKCKLSEIQITQIYNKTKRVWSITDEVLEELDSDLQKIINCAQKDDILSFQTAKVVTPKSTLSIPWNLTLTSGVTLSSTSGSSEVEPSPVSFTCPKKGSLIDTESQWLTLTNINILHCRRSGTIISIHPSCDGVQQQGAIYLKNVQFTNNALYGNQRIVDFWYPYCSSLILENVVVRGNHCEEQDCFALPTNSSLMNVQVSKNSGHQSCLQSQAVFFILMQSQISVKRVSADNNKIRIFGMDYAANLTLSESNFTRNKPVMSSFFGGAVGGGVIYAKKSIISIERSSFDENVAPNGGSVLTLDSELTVKSSSFTKGLSEDSEGGAIFVNRSTLSVFRSSFDENKAVGNGAAIFAERSKLEVQKMKMTGSYASVSGTLFLKNCTAKIEESQFENNVAEWFGGGMDTIGSKLQIKKSDFINNNASSGSGLSIRYQSKAKVLDCYFNGNSARYFGALHANEGSRLEVKGTNFEHNVANSGGALYLVTGTHVKVSFSYFNTNIARYTGGAVHLRFKTKLSVSKSAFSNNEAKERNGGAIFSDQCTVSMYSTTLDLNKGKAGGTGYITGAFVRFFDCTIGNSVAAENGGGLYLGKCKAHLRRTNLYANNATVNGGGLYLGDGTELNGKWLVFKGNVAEKGGGVAISSDSNYECKNCTYKFNKAKVGENMYTEHEDHIESIVIV
eukprot:g6122.t1